MGVYRLYHIAFFILLQFVQASFSLLLAHFLSKDLEPCFLFGKGGRDIVEETLPRSNGFVKKKSKQNYYLYIHSNLGGCLLYEKNVGAGSFF